MRLTKYLCSLCMMISMIFSVCVPAYASESSVAMDNINLSRDHAYFDSELGAYVIPFTINDDNSIEYLSKEEVAQFSYQDDNISETDFVLPELGTMNGIESGISPQDNYREWYTFTPSGSPTKYVGSSRKVSADFEAPRAGGSVSKTVSFSVSHSFSANVSTQSQKSAIQAGCGFTWVTSASSSTTYTANLNPGERGYLSFQPYYNKVTGALKYYSNWDGLISTKTATGYSVKKTSDGEPDGLYKFIYY